MTGPSRNAAIARLRSEIAGSVIDDAYALSPWRGDASHLRGSPLAVVRPEGVDDVVRLIGWARTHRIPVVARGAGTSLDGESVPPDGSVVLDLSGWTATVEIDATERRARVGPGVVNRDLQRAAEGVGLFFPPNPGSWSSSTIGGNVATNASGPRSYRYGPTRTWTCGATVVLGTGEVVHVGTRARKRSAGPDPLGYLIGSEGTLGIFTEIEVRLAPVPVERVALVVPSGSEEAAAALALRLDRLRGPAISAIEYVDGASTAALARVASRPLPVGGPLVLLEVETTPDDQARSLERVDEAIRATGIRDDPLLYPDTNDLWTLRGQSGSVLDAEHGLRVREDVAVPLQRLLELFRLIHRLADEEGVALWTYGHLGDGHLHPNFGTDPAGAAAARLRERLWSGVHALGGTISGEHGVGMLKREAIASEHPPAALAWMRAVRSVCDPDGILNPGKLYPSRPPGGGSSSPSPAGPAASRAPSG